MDDQVSQHDEVCIGYKKSVNCKLLILYFKKRNETYQREYYKHCMKSKTPNVLLCPNKGMFKYGNENQKNITRILK